MKRRGNAPTSTPRPAHYDRGPGAPNSRPDTGVLYSVDDIARMARVTNVVVVRLCLCGSMPQWLEIDGKRYWSRAGAVEAVARISMARTDDAA